MGDLRDDLDFGKRRKVNFEYGLQLIMLTNQGNGQTGNLLLTHINQQTFKTGIYYLPNFSKFESP